MSAPNESAAVRKLFDTGLFNLKTEDGQGAFTDACVSMLHGRDPNWGHLIKKPGQTDVHGHGEDAALYKLPDGKAQAVDFIGGAGGPNPQPGWMVDEPRYTHADWADPTAHGFAVKVPAPVLVAPVLPTRQELMAEMAHLHAVYKTDLYRTDGLWIDDHPDFEGIGAWVLDVYLAARVAGRTPEHSRQLYLDAIRASDEYRAKHP